MPPNVGLDADEPAPAPDDATGIEAENARQSDQE